MSLLCATNYIWSNSGEIQQNCSKLKISTSILSWSFSVSADKRNTILRREWNWFLMSNLVAFFGIICDILQVLQVSQYNNEASLCGRHLRTYKSLEEHTKRLKFYVWPDKQLINILATVCSSLLAELMSQIDVQVFFIWIESIFHFWEKKGGKSIIQKKRLCFWNNFLSFNIYRTFIYLKSSSQI